MALETMRAYEVHFIRDEDGKESWHLAKNKKEAVDAHLLHWGKDSISINSQHLSMIRKKIGLCRSKVCLAAVGLKPEQLASIEDQLAD